MNYFYFDAGIHRFLTKEHQTEKKQKEIDRLISALAVISGVDLYTGFKSIWAPGLYLECVNLGTELLKEIVKKIEPFNLSKLPSDERLDDWFTQTQKHIEKVVIEMLRKHLPLPSLPLHMIGYAGGKLANDLNDRYNNEEKNS